jgi:alginate O-acetyltransferase complex protein AlgI
MLFNSLLFPVFLAVSYLVWSLIQRWRWPRMAWLLLISAFFYGCWHPWYLVLIGLSTINSFYFGGWIGRVREESLRKGLMITSVTLDLLLLGVFKYGNFFLENVETLAPLLGQEWSLPRIDSELPVGISFYTFQSLSYTVDVYRKKLQPTSSLLDFSTFVFFFPQLVAGPIVRARHFLPQLELRPRMDARAFGEGLFLILAGLTKKMVIADTLYTSIVRPYFQGPSSHNAVETLVAVWAANFQVYCDFSGYSDVAIGAALMFGFALPKNFDRPFISRTPMEHWRRWHISLSFFLRDYLYIPLGGSRHGEVRTTFALVLTFLLGGLWHGAGWTFVVWGFYNGVLLVFWRKWGPRPAKSWWGIGLQIFVTFHAISVGLIFLHAASFSDAWDAFATFGTWGTPSSETLPLVGLLALGAGILLHISPLSWKDRLRDGFAVAPAWGLACIVILVGAVLSLFAGITTPFFYFQF